ncbi:MAG: DUF6265 family protein [Cellulophaga sp.]
MKNILFSAFILITYAMAAQSNTDVYLLDMNISEGHITLGNLQNISNSEGYDNQPSFYGDYLLFASTRNKQTDILQYHLKTKKTKWISDTPNGGEYSPLKIPNKKSISAVRLDANGVQFLYSYTLKKGDSKVLLKDLVVGYHTWFNKNTIVSAVLGKNALELVVSNTKTNTNTTIQTKIGRSLHKIPNTNLISYISKENNIWEIRSLDPITGITKKITTTLSGVEDICWLNNGTILASKDDIIYKMNPSIDSDWSILKTFENKNISKISRLATNKSGTKLAIVAEEMVAKLKNIAWISGDWKGEAFGGITEENWSKPQGGSMMAAFKLIVENEVIFYEIEIIREVNNTLILQLKHFGKDLKGWETKDQTVDFKLKKITPNKVVFEGMLFEKVSDNEMNIYVDIKNDEGVVEITKFNYTKN